MTVDSSDDRSPFRVPDFAADEHVRARYRSVAREVIGAAIARGLAALREEQALVRARLTAAAERAEAEQRAADNAAHVARAKYAKIVPKQRTASGIVKPPTLFFDLLLSVGAADKYYDDTIVTAQRKTETTAASRAAFAELQRQTGTFEAALIVRELEIRRHFKTAAGQVELDADPRLHGIAVQCAEIERERSDFRARSEAGQVSSEELRDRTMAQDGSRYLDGDVRGLQCLRERDIRFGTLAYLTFRDRDGRIWLLDYRIELRSLMTGTYDVVLANDRYLIARSASEGARLDRHVTRRPAGPDPRAGLGVDPALMRAIVAFVERERATL